MSDIPSEIAPGTRPASAPQVMPHRVAILLAGFGALGLAACDAHVLSRRIVVPLAPSAGGPASNRDCIDACLLIGERSGAQGASCLEQCPGARLEAKAGCEEGVPEQAACYLVRQTHYTWSLEKTAVVLQATAEVASAVTEIAAASNESHGQGHASGRPSSGHSRDSSASPCRPHAPANPTQSKHAPHRPAEVSQRRE